MTGAYQDIMGDMHNLFGRVNEIHVFVDDEDPEDFYIEEVIPGDTIEKVLSRVQYEPAELFRRVKGALDAEGEGGRDPAEGGRLARRLLRGGDEGLHVPRRPLEATAGARPLAARPRPR